MKNLLMLAAFSAAALLVAPSTTIAQDAPAKDEKVKDKAVEKAKAMVYELTVDGMT